MFKIRVHQGGKYVVVKMRGNSEYPVRNWKQLSTKAREAVSESSDSALHMGLYECPASLARKVARQ